MQLLRPPLVALSIDVSQVVGGDLDTKMLLELEESQETGHVEGLRVKLHYFQDVCVDPLIHCTNSLLSLLLGVWALMKDTLDIAHRTSNSCFAVVIVSAAR